MSEWVLVAFVIGAMLGAWFENALMTEMLYANACWRDNEWTDTFTGYVKIKPRRPR